MERKQVIFVAGVYGVGKSYICEKLSQRLGIKAVSASEVITAETGELYGRNKVVKEKKKIKNNLLKD